MRRGVVACVGALAIVVLLATASLSGCAAGEDDLKADANQNNNSGDGGGGQCDFCGDSDACCGGFCADTRTNIMHCGGCNNACALPTADGCANAQCTCNFGPACPDGQRCCGGIGCKDTMTDTLNCGACGNACGANESCEGGMCVCAGEGAQCSGTTCCGAGCTDTMTDLSNCGDCNNVCGGTDPMCNQGTCECSGCDPDFPVPGCCSDGCKDLCTDLANCGACGNDCGMGGICFFGSCDLMNPIFECITLPM